MNPRCASPACIRSAFPRPELDVDTLCQSCPLAASAETLGMSGCSLVSSNHPHRASVRTLTLPPAMMRGSPKDLKPCWVQTLLISAMAI